MKNISKQKVKILLSLKFLKEQWKYLMGKIEVQNNFQSISKLGKINQKKKYMIKNQSQKNKLINKLMNLLYFNLKLTKIQKKFIKNLYNNKF